MTSRQKTLTGVAVVFGGIVALVGGMVVPNQPQAVNDGVLAATPSVQPVGRGALSKDDLEPWFRFFERTICVAMKGSLPDRRIATPQDRRRALDEFMNADPSRIPMPIRHFYYRARLLWARSWREPWDPRRDSYWEDFRAIQEVLMRPRVGMQDGLSDVELLLHLAEVYWGAVEFEPPGSVLDEFKQQGNGASRKVYSDLVEDYRERHYINRQEAVRIYRYILDNFDPNYLGVIRTKTLLIGSFITDEVYGIDSMALYRSILKADPTLWYDIDFIENGLPFPSESYYAFFLRMLFERGKFWTESYLLGFSLDRMKMHRASMPGEMARSVWLLRPPARALSELQKLAIEWEQEGRLDSELRQLLAESLVKASVALAVKEGKVDLHGNDEQLLEGSIPVVVENAGSLSMLADEVTGALEAFRKNPGYTVRELRILDRLERGE